MTITDEIDEEAIRRALAVYDRLPRELRKVIRTSPINISPAKVWAVHVRTGYNLAETIRKVKNWISQTVALNEAEKGFSRNGSNV